jgi:hypothetical protein
MAYVPDHMVIYACTQITNAGVPNEISPFIKYLEEGKEFTPTLRRWLIELLKPDGSNRHFLEFRARRGRRKSLEEFEQDTRTYERVSELEGSIITRTFCQDFSAISGMLQAPDADLNPQTYRYGWQERDYMGDFIDVNLTLTIGKEFNSDQIHKIVAAESASSISTVKRIVRSRKELSYPDA